ncbi:hypothetical protein HMPREF9970_1528 [Lachnoanaerobaculum saburreum F0468]|uniref:Uncharacterized protein n=1 Tax=Lachnoanaerobaculum saburreum F0468 TaxID=1095750 RepID=I0R8Z3_9FIRM|nr:hypothetical protein HMPREF9970_1528 [Lachnoanaerobaculum saburreum F0468]
MVGISTTGGNSPKRVTIYLYKNLFKIQLNILKDFGFINYIYFNLIYKKYIVFASMYDYTK